MNLPTIHVLHQSGSNSVHPNYIFFLREKDGRIVFDDERLDLTDEELVYGADTFARKHAPEFPCAMHVFARDEISEPSWKTSQWLWYLGMKGDWTVYTDINSSLVHFCPNFTSYYPAAPKYLQIVFTKIGSPLGS